VPKKDNATTQAEVIGEKLMAVLGHGAVEKVARRCGFLRRRRDSTPLLEKPFATSRSTTRSASRKTGRLAAGLRHVAVA